MRPVPVISLPGGESAASDEAARVGVDTSSEWWVSVTVRVRLGQLTVDEAILLARGTEQMQCISCGGTDDRCSAYHPDYSFSCILPDHAGPHFDPAGGHWDDRGQVLRWRGRRRLEVIPDIPYDDGPRDCS